MASVGDDGKTLIWDVFSPVPKENIVELQPTLNHNSGTEINMLQWPITHPNQISIIFNNKLQMLTI